MNNPVKIGVLGAGTVATYAVMAPAKKDGAVEIVAVGARDGARAQAYAVEHGIPRGMTYQALIDDAEIEAVYVATPNAAHREWALKALGAGKPVLCEKPLAANAAEAKIMADAVAASGGILVDAIHSRYHPLSDRVRDIVSTGMLGDITHARFTFLVPRAMVEPDNIRFRYDLAGGCTMDVGYYAVSFLRHTLGAEPDEVRRAEATITAPDIDGAMLAELVYPTAYPGGCTAHLDLSLVSTDENMTITAEITGTKGRMIVDNPVHPSAGKGITLELDGKTTHEPADPARTFILQARAFAANVREQTPVLTPASESVAIMQTVDDIYRAAGLQVRGGA